MIVNYFEFLENDSNEKEGLIQKYLKKIRPSLITSLSVSDQPELQYAVLKNVQLLVQKFPSFLENEVKSFFCRHSDPAYAKVIKLELLTNLITENNYNNLRA